ncbi:hypothetical protein [Bifidobacterium crudilactis]|jgi:hypothetical protein|uniref:hypothetical protein n=1 Tax=Bifidobacterium crudilactis TaxID=327277 RepID=UPI002F357D7A|nr:hypothetical protein [Bifidobacterium crudilactis]
MHSAVLLLFIVVRVVYRQGRPWAKRPAGSLAQLTELCRMLAASPQKAAEVQRIAAGDAVIENRR